MTCNGHGNGRGEKEGLGIRKRVCAKPLGSREPATVVKMGKVSVAGAAMEMPAITNSHMAPTAGHVPPCLVSMVY